MKRYGVSQRRAQPALRQTITRAKKVRNFTPGRLTAFELGPDNRYREVADVAGDEPFTAERPFPVTIVPARLLDGLRSD